MLSDYTTVFLVQAITKYYIKFIMPYCNSLFQSAIFSLCSGKYGDAVTLKTLKDFHRRRLQILAKSGADLIAFETIPNMLEAKVVNIYFLITQIRMKWLISK